jgi:hypothetical protein
MGNARKHIFYPNIYPNINCILCQTKVINTWPHLLLACTDKNIHKSRIKRHNNAIWKLLKLFLNNKTSRCYTLVNIGHKKQQHSIVPPWTNAL